LSLVYRRAPSVEAAPMEGETLLYHPDTKKFCRLNETAAFLWERLAEPRSLEELAVEVRDAFDGVDLEQAREDVRNAVEELAGISIVEQV